MGILLLLSAAFAGGKASAERALVPPAIGAKVGDVAMKDVSGRIRSLREFKNKKAIVVIFVGTECPIANLYFPTLAEMQKRYADKGVQILAINSNDQDTFADVVAHASERKLPFPICKDADQRARRKRLGHGALRKLFFSTVTARSVTVDALTTNTATLIGARFRLIRNSRTL